jgi:nucleoside-diphosphate-sugar epimerase
MKIVVIGGTGLIGSKTVVILRQGGHEVIAASPKSGINDHRRGAQGGDGRAQVVIDLTTSPSFEALLEFFETSGRNLLPEEAAAGVRHHLARIDRRNRPDARQRLFPRQGRPRKTERDLRL